jgi:hypothetical protein
MRKVECTSAQDSEIAGLFEVIYLYILTD